MKRALSIFGIVGVTALTTYLAITRQQAQERAAKLDLALQDAEARVIDLEAEIDAAKQRLAELLRAQQASRPVAAPPRAARAAVPTAGPTSAEPSPPATGVTAAVPSAAAGASGVAVAVAAPVVLGPLVRYTAFSGAGLTSVVRIEGTSTIHDWQVEGHLIGGSAEFGPGFASPPGAEAAAGPVEAKVSVFIPVRSLKSVEKDGRPYSDAMDEIMYGKLREPVNKRITYTLTALTLQEQLPGVTGPFLYEAAGNLCVAGVTNAITMPVTVLADPSGRIQLTGSVKVKMTDFKIDPPSPTLPGGAAIKTGDEVTLKFAWWAKRLGPAQASR
jgi:hypothetical protein